MGVGGWVGGEHPAALSAAETGGIFLNFSNKAIQMPVWEIERGALGSAEDE